jgi:hypothetical protein
MTSTTSSNAGEAGAVDDDEEDESLEDVDTGVVVVPGALSCMDSTKIPTRIVAVSMSWMIIVLDDNVRWPHDSTYFFARIRQRRYIKKIGSTTDGTAIHQNTNLAGRVHVRPHSHFHPFL